MLSKTLLASALLCAVLPAQREKVIPPTATGEDANDSSYFPFVYEGGSRTQQLIDGAAITPGSAVLQQFAYRRDAANTNTFTARSIPNFTVTIGYSALTPATMSTTFASNRTGAQTTVFQGTYNRPAQPPATGVGVFNVVFKLTQPFVYIRTRGNLLIELEEAGQATNKNEYVLDSFRSPGTGSSGTFGAQGQLTTQEKYRVTCPDNLALKPGGTIKMFADGLAKPYPAAAIFGFSNLAFGAVNLPFDLAPIGAPGNYAHVSLDLIFPLVLTQNGTIYQGTAQLPIPAAAALAGFAFFGQVIFADAAANPMGIVWSNGVAFLISGDAPSQLLGQSDSTSATGSFLYGSQVTGGPVIALTGSLY